MKNIFMRFGLLLLLTLFYTLMHAQRIQQRLNASSTNAPHSVKYGTRMTSDGNTIVVSDPSYREADCGGITGRVYVYKYNSGTYVLDQVLNGSSGGRSAFFGKEISLSNNVLVVVAPMEANLRGAFYVFRRTSESEPFTLVKKILSSYSSVYSFYNNKSVATNGKYIAIPSATKEEIYYFNITTNDVKLVQTIPTPGYLPSSVAITSENILVAAKANAQNVLLYKLDDVSATTLDNSALQLYYSNAYDGKVTSDGNTVLLSSAYNTYRYWGSAYEIIHSGTTTSIIPKGTVKVDGQSGVSPSSLAIRENYGIAISYLNAAGSFIGFSRYTSNGYVPAGFTDKPTNYAATSAFGSAIALNNGSLLIADPEYVVAGTNPNCSSNKTGGAVFVCPVEERITHPVTGITRVLNTFPSDGDVMGYNVEVSGDYAAVGVPYDDQVANNAGSVLLYRKVDGQWKHYTRYHNEDSGPLNQQSFGRSIELTDQFLAIAAESNHPAITILKKENGLFPTNGSSAQVIAAAKSDITGWGRDMKIYGNTLVFTSPNEPDNAYSTGAVYIYEFNGSGWIFKQRLVRPTSTNTGRFGYSVGIHGDFIMVGAADDNRYAPAAGAVYIFRKINGTWTYDGNGGVTLPASYRLGSKISMSADYAIATSGYEHGTIVVYRFTGSTYEFDRSIIYIETQPYSDMKVEVSGRQIVAAVETGRGQVKVFEKITTSWSATRTYELFTPDHFMLDVDMDENTIVTSAMNMEEPVFVSSGGAYFIDRATAVSNARLAAPLFSGEETAADVLVVAPNPVRGDRLNFSVPEEEGTIKSVHILDLSGKEIQVPVNGSYADVSSLETGTYILKVETSKEVLVKKFVISH